MISERELAEVHTSFWEAVTPNLNRVVRSINLSGRDSFLPPIKTNIAPDRAYLLNEAGFQAAKALTSGKSTDANSIMAEVSAKFQLEGVSHDPFDNFDKEEINYINELSFRIIDGIPPYVKHGGTAIFDPYFPGVGILAACRGDIRFGETLVEVKSGERNLRAIDFRQILVYFLLNEASDEEQLSAFLIINPRQGYRIFLDFLDLTAAASGLSLVELRSAFGDYLIDWEVCSNRSRS